MITVGKETTELAAVLSADMPRILFFIHFNALFSSPLYYGFFNSFIFLFSEFSTACLYVRFGISYDSVRQYDSQNSTIS